MGLIAELSGVLAILVLVLPLNRRCSSRTAPASMAHWRHFPIFDVQHYSSHGKEGKTKTCGEEEHALSPGRQ